MSIENDYLDLAIRAPRSAWSRGNIERLASMEVPFPFLGRRRGLLKADSHRQWARWFAESLLDPGACELEALDYVSVFEVVFGSVKEVFGNEKTSAELKELASTAARAIFATSLNRRTQAQRRTVTLDERSTLLELAGEPPRCWICGSRFKDECVEAFLCGQPVVPRSDAFIDILRPRGLKHRDYKIEIDHVVPFSSGGGEEENLRLACGWCNSVKAANVSLYNVPGVPKRAERNGLGVYSLPQPFWVVRALALVRNCEHLGGCSRSADNAEMTVAPFKVRGAMNPTNLSVVCTDHDPLREKRLQTSEVVRRLWGMSK